MSTPPTSKPPERVCRKCAAPLGPDAKQSFCSRCLLDQGAAPLVFPDWDDQTADDQDERDMPASGNPRRIGNFDLLEEIGRGGMGVVYRARQRHLDRLVAVKLLHLGAMAGEEFIKRLRMEATTAGCLRHPNIVGIHEVGIAEDQHFLAMDYVAGQNLGALANQRPLASQRASRMVQRLAEAVQYAHDQGILHRDLKPSNILIDAADEPHITDFGLAKRLRSSVRENAGEETRGWINDFESMTLTGQVLGSPNYMPPEQAASDRAKMGRVSDVYSLGAILYQLLTGRPPFVGETVAATLRQVLETEAPSPRLLNPRVPVDLETICLKCLQKEPEQRYATAKELADELTRFTDGQAIRARPISPVHRWWRWCRRNPMLSGSLATTLVLILTVAIGSPIAVWRIEQSRVQVDAQRSEAQRLLYASNMNLVQRAWENENFVTIRQLLDETRDSEERGFEWEFWSQQLRWAMQGMQGHVDSVFSAVPSPDGRWIASGSADRTVKIWDAQTGKETFTLRGHNSWVVSVAWSPDSRRLATGGLDHHVRVWDAIQGTALRKISPGRGRVRAVALGADGQTVYSGHQDGRIVIWSLDRDELVGSLDAHSGSVASLALSPDRRFLASGGSDRTVRIWDLARGVLAKTLMETLDTVDSVAFSPDGERLVSVNGFRSVVIWDVASGQTLHRLVGHSGNVKSVAYSPNGEWIATAGTDQTTKLWDAKSGREVKTLNAPMKEVSSVHFTPDGRHLVIGANDGMVWLWRVTADPQDLRLRSTQSALGPVVLNPDGQIMMPRGNAQETLWQAVRGRYLFQLGRADGLQSMALSADGQYLAAGQLPREAKVWRTDTGELQSDLWGLPASPLAIGFSPDGQQVAVGSFSGVVKVWNVRTGLELLELEGHLDEIATLAFSPDGRTIVTGSRDESAIVWDAKTSEQLMRLPVTSGVLRSVSFSPDGQEVLTAATDQTARIWRVADGFERLTIRGHTDSVEGAAFSPDGTRVVTTSYDRTVRLWDAVNGKMLLSLNTSLAGASSVAFTPDGLRMVAVQGGGQVLQWQLASPADERQRIREERQTVERVARERQAHQDWLVARRESRRNDPGVMRRWLLLGPLPLDQELWSKAGVGGVFLPQEALLEPRAGDSVSVDSLDLTWSAVEVSDGLIDVNALVGQKVESSVVYLVTYLDSETAQSGLRLLVGSDDQSLVYLNGREVYRSDFNRAFIPDEDLVTGLDLLAGRNVVVFKIVNATAGWEGALRLQDAQGQSIRGVSFGLHP